MAHGLGNPHRLLGAAAKREREALAALASKRCPLDNEPAAALVQSWDGTLRPACKAHAAVGEARGYRVVYPPARAG
jgi:hypothetical protein